MILFFFGSNVDVVRLRTPHHYYYYLTFPLWRKREREKETERARARERAYECLSIKSMQRWLCVCLLFIAAAWLLLSSFPCETIITTQYTDSLPYVRWIILCRWCVFFSLLCSIVTVRCCCFAFFSLQICFFFFLIFIWFFLFYCKLKEIR